MGRSVLLIVNRGKPSASAGAAEIRSLVEGAGGRVAAELGSEDGAIDDARGADLVGVLGGDGTFLAQVRRISGLGLPMLGVNFGRVGFLAAFELGEVRSRASELFGGGDLPIERRMLMEVTARCGETGASRCERLALNDAAVVAGPPYRMISVGLSLDGVSGPVVHGDGVVVATGTGSTGYSVSAGGPIVAPGVEALSVSAIAAHSLGFRPLVIPGSCELVLRMEQVNPRPEERSAAARAGRELDDSVGTTLVLDGQWQQRVWSGDEVRIRRASREALLVGNRERSYYETLMQKMHWASRPGV